MSAKLFQLKDVRLTSSTAAAKIDPKTPLPQVAKELGVNLIVHGTVQGSGDSLRVTVNLENVAENSTDEDADYTTLVEVLVYSNENPINLNKTNREELQALQFFFFFI